MIDRSRKFASPFGGPWFMRRYYRTIPINYEIPFTTLAWGIGKIEPFGPGADLRSGSWSLSVFETGGRRFSPPAIFGRWTCGPRPLPRRKKTREI